jgi:Phosphodiester glycosidase
VDGLNRKPGLIRGCGGDGGDAPTEEPKHDFTCTDESELILFTPDLGKRTEPGTGVEAVRDSSGRVTKKLREGRGGRIPRNGSVLSGTGEAAGWLSAHAQRGARITVSTSITADGAPLATGTGVVNGGPRLLSGGEPDITAYQEGFVWPENPEFYYRFGVRRNPRTLAGITPEGNLLLVAVDGRQPGYSVGASFEERAHHAGALRRRGRQPRRRRLHRDDHRRGSGQPTLGLHRRAANRRRDSPAALGVAASPARYQHSAVSHQLADAARLLFAGKRFASSGFP